MTLHTFQTPKWHRVLGLACAWVALGFGGQVSSAEELRMDSALKPVPATAAPAAMDDPVETFLLTREQPQPKLVSEVSLSPAKPAVQAPALSAPEATVVPTATPAPHLAVVPAPTQQSATGSAPSAKTPAKTATEPELPLGVGDQIGITVFGQPDLSAEVTVGESGVIMVPLIGTLNVLNLSAAQLENLVAKRLKEGGYLQNPGVSAQVRQLRSQLVSVMGEVQRPGRYPIQGRMTVLEALATAGGLTSRADRQVLLLRRPRGATETTGSNLREEVRISLDVSAGPLAGQADAALLNDDVILVGVQKQFFVHGEVRRPGAYPMEPGMNVMKAISIGGGITERGSSRRISIHRQKDGHGAVQELPATLTAPVLPDDVIHVDERLF